MKTILYYCLTLLLCISVCNMAEAKKKKYPNGNVYEGEWKSGQPEGKGKMVYANGDVYEGEWRNGQREGVGKIILVNGTRFEGNWKNGLQEGKGKTIYPNGDVYEGEWIKGKILEKGKMTYANGNVYEGEWKSGQPEGWGKMIYANGEIYEGNWVNGQREGRGKIILVNGTTFEGNWKNGLQEGKGKTIYPNGDVYEGEWKKGKIFGYGKMTYANGDVYEGEWFLGGSFGSGKMIYANGDIYEGEWKNGHPEGKGQITYANGDKYECEGKNGEIRLLIHPNVNNISEFIGVKNENGTMTGKVHYTNNNYFYEGELREYKRYGKGAYYFTPKDYITGIWKNDSLTSGSGEFFISGNAANVTKEANRPFYFIIKISENNELILRKLIQVNKKFTIDQLYDIASSEIDKIKENLFEELQLQAERKERWEREEKEKIERPKQEEKEKVKQELIKKYGVKFANAIVKGQIIVGMTKDMVKQVRNRWTGVRKETTDRGVVEIWKYSNPGRYYGESAQLYISGYYLEVVFVNGKVTSISERED